MHGMLQDMYRKTRQTYTKTHRKHGKTTKMHTKTQKLLGWHMIQRQVRNVGCLKKQQLIQQQLEQRDTAGREWVD